MLGEKLSSTGLLSVVIACGCGVGEDRRLMGHPVLNLQQSPPSDMPLKLDITAFQVLKTCH